MHHSRRRTRACAAQATERGSVHRTNGASGARAATVRAQEGAR
ncbi:hypothetical protein AB0910_24475 [Streptomyces sp. NPDC047002]